jgi:hypothetical protein
MHTCTLVKEWYRHFLTFHLAGCPNQQPYPILTCLLLSLISLDVIRGIAINSCIGKLFNSILNKRLDKYLETHNIINPCQIGFTSKSRTSDHMFVLKSFIDKYNSGKGGGKLFACFVDFKKAFDL